ncbi:MAG: acyltransferase [Dehalococcoidia bacterium]|nr:acyltransferase [Dehalococcoidia bacterium]
MTRGYLIVADDAFIGINAVVLPNVRIGRHAVVGAGAVVTHDVPDFCVAAGNPARVISRYDFGRRVWIRARAVEPASSHLGRRAPVPGLAPQPGAAAGDDGDERRRAA